MLNGRSSQILVAFTFWDPSALDIRTPRGLYELRSYTLKVSYSMVFITLEKLVLYCIAWSSNRVGSNVVGILN